MEKWLDSHYAVFHFLQSTIVSVEFITLKKYIIHFIWGFCQFKALHYGRKVLQSTQNCVQTRSLLRIWNEKRKFLLSLRDVKLPIRFCQWRFLSAVQRQTIQWRPKWVEHSERFLLFFIEQAAQIPIQQMEDLQSLLCSVNYRWGDSAHFSDERQAQPISPSVSHKQVPSQEVK